MALDPLLLEKFERDWNDALANYEARTTASRLGNVQYDPGSRTFAPEEVDPKVAMGIQSELFGPLQSKWGMLQEGRGRAATAQIPESEWGTPMNVGGGEVVRFNRAGEREILNERRQEPPRQSPQQEYDARINQMRIASELKTIDSDIMAHQRQLASTTDMDERLRIVQRLSSLSRMKKSLFDSAAMPAQDAPAIQTPALDMSNFAQDPSQMMRPIPTPQTFMGDPGAPTIQDPPMAPLPTGPSVQRGLRILNIRPTER